MGANEEEARAYVLDRKADDIFGASDTVSEKIYKEIAEIAKKTAEAKRGEESASMRLMKSVMSGGEIGGAPEIPDISDRSGLFVDGFTWTQSQQGTGVSGMSWAYVRHYEVAMGFSVFYKSPGTVPIWGPTPNATGKVVSVASTYNSQYARDANGVASAINYTSFSVVSDQFFLGPPLNASPYLKGSGLYGYDLATHVEISPGTTPLNTNQTSGYANWGIVPNVSGVPSPQARTGGCFFDGAFLGNVTPTGKKDSQEQEDISARDQGVVMVQGVSGMNFGARPFNLSTELLHQGGKAGIVPNLLTTGRLSNGFAGGNVTSLVSLAAPAITSVGTTAFPTLGTAGEGGVPSLFGSLCCLTSFGSMNYFPTASAPGQDITVVTQFVSPFDSVGYVFRCRLQANNQQPAIPTGGTNVPAAACSFVATIKVVSYWQQVFYEGNITSPQFLYLQTVDEIAVPWFVEANGTDNANSTAIQSTSFFSNALSSVTSVQNGTTTTDVNIMSVGQGNFKFQVLLDKPAGYQYSHSFVQCIQNTAGGFANALPVQLLVYDIDQILPNLNKEGFYGPFDVVSVNNILGNSEVLMKARGYYAAIPSAALAVFRPPQSDQVSAEYDRAHKDTIEALRVMYGSRLVHYVRKFFTKKAWVVLLGEMKSATWNPLKMAAITKDDKNAFAANAGVFGSFFDQLQGAAKKAVSMAKEANSFLPKGLANSLIDKGASLAVENLQKLNPTLGAVGGYALDQGAGALKNAMADAYASIPRGGGPPSREEFDRYIRNRRRLEEQGASKADLDQIYSDGFATKNPDPYSRGAPAHVLGGPSTYRKNLALGLANLPGDYAPSSVYWDRFAGGNTDPNFGAYVEKLKDGRDAVGWNNYPLEYATTHPGATEAQMSAAERAYEAQQVGAIPLPAKQVGARFSLHRQANARGRAPAGVVDALAQEQAQKGVAFAQKKATDFDARTRDLLRGRAGEYDGDSANEEQARAFDWGNFGSAVLAGAQAGLPIVSQLLG